MSLENVRLPYAVIKKMNGLHFFTNGMDSIKQKLWKEMISIIFAMWDLYP